MTRKEIQNLIKETEDIELKSSLSLINEIIETISGFANTKGGKVIVGVDNAGRIIGIEIGNGTIENLTNRIAQNTDSKIHPKISVKEIEGKKIIVIEVKESLDRLVLAFGWPFKRVGKSTMKIGKDEYERLILEKHKEKLQFDKEICGEASLKDLDWEFVKEKFKFFLILYANRKNLITQIKDKITQIFRRWFYLCNLLLIYVIRSFPYQIYKFLLSLYFR